MMEQIRELLPSLELPLLRQVVRQSLADPAVGDDIKETLDVTKCDSLWWLLQHEEHLGDALICANILLRDFLLDEDGDKMDIAMKFVNEYLRQDLLDHAGETLPPGLEDVESTSGTDMDVSGYLNKVNNARSEHLAYVSYLEAYTVFENWKKVLKETPTVVKDYQFVDTTNLNDTELEIANRTFLKNWIREKKEHFEAVIEAAEAARVALHKVLTHPGGWLSTEDEEHGDIMDKEEKLRQEDITKVRSRHLVLAVSLYHQVCEETASWISRSLDDAAAVSLTRKQVLPMLDPHNGDESGDSLMSSFSTAFWYHHALDLASLVASDSHGIYKAFSPADLEDLMAKFAETSVSTLMNSY
jgi:hypothetical protein